MKTRQIIVVGLEYEQAKDVGPLKHVRKVTFAARFDLSLK